MKAIFMGLFFAKSLLASDYAGTYELKVNIQGQSYIDILILNNPNSLGEVKGTFEVPKVFKSSFSGKIVGQKITGKFLANERGQNFLVHLNAHFIKSCKIAGELLQNEIVFGRFLGEKEDCDE